MAGRAAFVEHLGSQIIQGGQPQPIYISNSDSVLEANTTYWLTLGEGGSGGGSFDWLATTSTAQASPEGWTLGDQIAFNDGDGWEEFSLGPANESGRLSIDVLPVGPFVPPSMQGDVNMDGDVDFLDIGPFITLLSSGMFQVEADTNNDGYGRLSWISQSFIAILSGNVIPDDSPLVGCVIRV